MGHAPPRTAARKTPRWVWLAGVGVAAAALAFSVPILFTGSSAGAAERAEGYKLLELKRYADAEKRFEAALAANPNDADAVQGLIRIAVAQERTDDAIRHLGRLAALTPSDPDLYALRAQLQEKVGRREEALNDYIRAVELRPDDPTRTKVAFIGADLGRYEASDPAFAALLDKSGPNREALAARFAKSYWDRGEPAQVAAVLDKYVPPPGPPAAVLLRGLLKFKDGRWAEAVDLFKSATPPDLTEKVVGTYHLAMALEKLGRTDESRKAFELLTKYERASLMESDAHQRPTDADLQVRAARALLDIGSPADAAKLLEPVTSRDESRTPEALKLLAECLDALNRSADAAAVRQQIKP